MKLLLETSRTAFTVTRAVEPKNDQDGRQKKDRKTDEPLWIVQVMALDETGGEMLNVTVAGTPPKVNVGQAATRRRSSWRPSPGRRTAGTASPSARNPSESPRPPARRPDPPRVIAPPSVRIRARNGCLR